MNIKFIKEVIILKFSKIMIVSLILLAIMALGAVSATDELAAGETQDSLELSVDDADIIAHDDVGVEKISDGNVSDPADDELIDPEMTAEFDQDEYALGDEAWISVELPENATGELTFYVNGEEWSTGAVNEEQWDEDLEDYVIVTTVGFGYDFDSFGEYDFEITYSGDETYNSDSVSLHYDLDNTKYSFTVDQVDYGSEYAYVNVPEGFNGGITVIVNGKEYEVTHEYDEDDDEDYYTFDASILNYGENNVTFTTEGDDNFGPCECNATVYVSGVISSPEDSIVYGEDYEISLQLPEDATGNLTVYTTYWDDEMDDEMPDEAIASQSLEDGFASLTLSDLNVGMQGFLAVYEGNYETISKSVSFDVLPIFNFPKSVIIGKKSYVTFEGSENLAGTLTVYSRIFDEDIWEYIYTELGSAEVVNGTASFALPDLEAGEYDIAATYLGDDETEYTESADVYFINSTDFEMDIYYDETVIFNSERNWVYIDLPEYLSGEVSLYIDDELVDSGNLDDEEYHNELAFDAVGLDYGTHTLEVRYVSDSEDFENATSGVMEFEIDSVSIIMPEEIVYNGETDNPQFFAVRVLVNPDATGEITILVDDEEYDVIGVEEDEVYYYSHIRGVPVGTHEITVIYSGDDNYRETSLSQEVNITYMIYVYGDEMRYGDDEEYVYISVPYDIIDGEFTVTIDGTPYEDFYDFDENTFKVSTPDLTYGNHTIIVKYAGDEIYPSIEFNDTIQVLSWIYIPSHWAENDDINLILPDNADGNLIVDIYTEEYDEDNGETVQTLLEHLEIPLENGEAHYSLDNYTMGEYYIECKYVDDDKYDISSNTQYFTMRVNVYWSDESEDEHAIPIGNNATIYMDAPGWEGRFLISLDRIIENYWDEDELEEIIIRETVVQENIPLKNGKANYTFTDLIMGDYLISYAYVVDGEELYQADESLEVTPVEINFPDELNDQEPIVISVVLPEDAAGDLKVTVSVWSVIDEEMDERDWVYYDEFNATFENGFAIVEMELGADDYRFEIICTTEDYGNYTKVFDWIYVEGEEVNPIDEIEFDAPDSDMTFTKGIETVAYILIPENDDQNVTLTITGHQASNPEILIVLNTSEIEGVYDEGKEAYVYPIALDLSQFKDGAFLEFRIEGLDEDVYWPYVLECGNDNVIFHEYAHDGVIEFEVFYGNLTTTHLNNPDLMGPDFNGNLINLGISDSLNITDGKITISNGDTVLYEKLLEDCERDYQYDILGYNYEIQLDEVELPENVNLTFTLSAENLSISLKRIRQADYVYKILTPDDFSINYWSYFNFTVCDEAVENSTVINILGDSNMQSIYIDFNGGQFNIYVDDVLVENNVTRNLTLEKLRNSIDFGGVDLNLSDLGINKSGTYNIRITHYPEVPSEGEYFIIAETELVNKDITVDLGEIIEPVDPALTVSADNIEVGADAVITVSVNETFSGNVLVQIGENNYTVTVTNGTGTLTVANLTAGNYTPIAVFEATELFTAGEANTTFAVNKLTPEIVITPGEAIEGSDLTVEVEIAGASGNVTVNGVTLALTDGKASVTIKNLTAGNLAVDVSYVGDDKYLAKSSSLNVTVRAQDDAGLKVTASDINVGENATVNVEISKNVTGKVTVDGVEVSIVDGKATITKEGLSEGEYTVTAVFEGDTYFKASNATATFKVSKVALDPTVDPFAPAENTTDSNNPVYTINMPADATGSLTVTAGNKTYTKDLVNGSATVEVTDLAPGEYEATVAYSGDSKYSPITKTENATVKVDSKIEATATTVQYSAGSLFSVTVYGTDGKVAAETPVVFKVDGVVFTTVNTNSNGVATFGVSQLPGKYTVTAEALGANATAQLTVKQILKLKKVKVKKSAKKLVLTATLKKVNGKYIKGKKIKFKFNGKKFTAKTNKKGVAKVTIKSKYLKKLKVGKKVTYQATYLKDTVKKSVKVKK